MKERKPMWNCSVEEISKGFREEQEEYVCVFCGQSYGKGRVYPIGELLYDACGAVRAHVREQHGDPADFLLQQSLALTGLSEIQRELLREISEGKNDKEIAAEAGIAQSTVRNHRFKLREKEKQARVFLALMNALERKIEKKASGEPVRLQENNLYQKSGGFIMKTDQGMIEEVHTTAAMVDDRYSITGQEREKTCKTYMDENGCLKQFPAREKKKIIVLKEIVKNFSAGVEYTEKEVNDILKRVYAEDYPSIRRALIEYGFMDRTDDCSVYRVR